MEGNFKCNQWRLKRLKKVNKRGSKSEYSLQNLTKVEQEVLHLLKNEYLTPKQIAIRRKTSDKAVYKIIAKIKGKGVLGNRLKGVEKNRYTFQPQPNHKIRLHGQVFKINLLYKDNRYKKKLEDSNLVNIDNNQIRLHRNSIIVYSENDFYGDTAQKATINSMAYWTRFFNRLEKDLGIIIVKHRKHNISLVKQHYAEINNELAEECERKAEKIRIYTKEDGKLWFTIDNSFNLSEAETQHRYTAEEDMEEIVQPHFNDLRNNRPPVPSEVWKIVAEITKHNHETAAGLNTLITLMNIKPKEDNELVPKEKPNYFG